MQEEYKNAVLNNVWHKRLEFPGGETIVMHNPNVIVHFQASSQPDEWGTVHVSNTRMEASSPFALRTYMFLLMFFPFLFFNANRVLNMYIEFFGGVTNILSKHTFTDPSNLTFSYFSV